MDSLYNEQKIKLELEKEVCPIHNQHPTIIPMYNDFIIISCCTEFADFLTSKCGSLMAHDVDNFIVKKIQGGLKEE